MSSTVTKGCFFMCRVAESLVTIACVWVSAVVLPTVGFAVTAAKTRGLADSSTIWVQLDRRAGTDTWTIELESAEKIGAIQLELVFPAAAEVKQTLPGRLLPSGLLESNLIEPGRLRVAVISSEPISGRGALVSLGFESLPTSLVEAGVRLENFKAWHQESLAAVELVTRPPVELSAGPNSPEPAPDLRLDPQHAEVNNVPVIDGATGAQDRAELEKLIKTILRDLERQPQSLQLVLPHWLAFVAGAATVLLVGWLVHSFRNLASPGKKA